MKAKAAFATLCILYGAAVGCTMQAAPGVPPAPPVLTACAEDDPCWDCATMGNLICGPTTAPNR
jgi:hypothetical protein